MVKICLTLDSLTSRAWVSSITRRQTSTAQFHLDKVAYEAKNPSVQHTEVTPILKLHNTIKLTI